jgi:hypothetical protein
LNLGVYEEAIGDFDEAIRLDPMFEEAQSNRRQAEMMGSPDLGSVTP